MLSRRLLAFGGMSATLAGPCRSAPLLQIGDQKGGSQSLLTASDPLNGADALGQWYTFAAAAPLLEALNAAAIDVGGVGDAPSPSPERPVRAKVIAATRSSGSSTALLVPACSNAGQFVDLKGRTIGTGRGSVGHFLTIVARDRAGLQPEDIKLAFLTPSDAKAAFVSGAIDAWATWSQYVYLAVAQNNARILIDGQGLMSSLSYTVASERAIASKRALPQVYVRRLTTAQYWGLEHVESYAKAWAAENIDVL